MEDAEVIELVQRAAALNVKLRARSGLLVADPVSGLPDDLRQKLRQYKAEVIEYLRRVEAGNGVEVSRHARVHAMSAVYTRVNAMAPGQWSTLYRTIKSNSGAWRRIQGAEAAVSAAGNADENTFRRALAALETAWITAMQGARL